MAKPAAHRAPSANYSDTHHLRRTAAALAVAACFSTSVALANPSNPVVVHGTATFATAGNILNITNSQNAVINWGSFSIGINELTKFIQPSALSAVLNRVIGQDPSAILGALQSNGRVFLINPNGITFGAGAQIDVAGLVASTLNLSNDDFLNNRLRFTDGAVAGNVVNQGSITGGSVYLVGKATTNDGLITSPNGEVVLAAGNSVELVNPGTPDLRVEIVAPDNAARNLGTIAAEAGRIGIYAGLIHNSGTLNASSAVAEGGRILLKATQNTTLAASSILDASGVNGGRIDVLADMAQGTTQVAGLLDVSATGPGTGNGGFVETSAADVQIGDSTLVRGHGSNGGASGRWLIDPTDAIISSGIVGLTASLNSGVDVTISTTDGGSDPGNITVDVPITWSSANSLTLVAHNNVLVDNAVTNTGSGGFSAYAGWDGAGTPQNSGFVPNLTGSGSVVVNAPISVGSVINLKAGGSVVINQSVTANGVNAFCCNLAPGGDATINLSGALVTIGSSVTASGGDGAEGGVGGTALVSVTAGAGGISVGEGGALNAYGGAGGSGFFAIPNTDGGRGGDATVNLSAGGPITIDIALGTAVSVVGGQGGVGGNDGFNGLTGGRGGDATLTATATSGGIHLNSGTVAVRGGFGGVGGAGVSSADTGGAGGIGGRGGDATATLNAYGGGAINLAGGLLNVQGGNGGSGGRGGTASSEAGAGGNGGDGGIAQLAMTTTGGGVINLTAGSITVQGGWGGSGGRADCSDCFTPDSGGAGGTAGKGGDATATFTANGMGGIVVAGAAISVEGGEGGYGGPGGNAFSFGGAGGRSGDGGHALLQMTTNGGGSISMTSGAMSVQGGKGGGSSSFGRGGFGSSIGGNAGDGGDGGNATATFVANSNGAISTTGGSITVQGGEGGRGARGGSGSTGGAGGAGGNGGHALLEMTTNGGGSISMTSTSITVNGGRGGGSRFSSGGGQGGSGNIAGAGGNGGDGGDATTTLIANNAGGITLTGGSINVVAGDGGDGGQGGSALTGGAGGNAGNGGAAALTLQTVGGGAIDANGFMAAYGGWGGFGGSGGGGEFRGPGGTGGDGGTADVTLTGSGALTIGGSSEIYAIGGAGIFGGSGGSAAGAGGNGGSAGISMTAAGAMSVSGTIRADGGEGAFASTTSGSATITLSSTGPLALSGAYITASGGSNSSSGPRGGDAEVTLESTAGSVSITSSSVYAEAGSAYYFASTPADGGAATMVVSSAGSTTVSSSTLHAHGGEGAYGGAGGAGLLGITAGGGITVNGGALDAIGGNGSGYFSNGGPGGMATLGLVAAGGGIVIDGAEGVAQGGGGSTGGDALVALAAAGGITVQNAPCCGSGQLRADAGSSGDASMILAAGGDILLNQTTLMSDGPVGLGGANITLSNNTFVRGNAGSGIDTGVTAIASGSLNVLSSSELNGRSGNALIVTGGDVLVDRSRIIGNPEVTMTVGGVINMNGESAYGGTIEAESVQTIFVHFPNLASGGYFVNGVEGVVYDPGTSTGFVAVGNAAILDTNLFITYGGGPVLNIPTDALIVAMGESLEPPEAEKNKDIFAETEDEKKKNAPICR